MEILRILCCDKCLTQARITIKNIRNNTEQHFCEAHYYEYLKKRSREHKKNMSIKERIKFRKDNWRLYV